MDKTFWTRSLGGYPDNRKSKFQNLQCLAVLATILLAPVSLGEAQQQAKVPRIGYLTGDSLSADLPRRDAFRQGLRELGYSERQNIVIEYRTAEGKVDRLSELAAELARLKVDVMFAFTTAAVRAVKKEMPTVPIVSVSADPVGTGLVASLARPGGNITGLSITAGPEVYGKQLELLKETVPKVSRVAVLWNPTNPGNPLQLKETQAAAPALGVTLLSLEVKGPDDIDGAFTAMRKERAGTLTVLPDPMFLAQRTRLADLAAKSRLPAIYGIPEHVVAGGLMAYAANRPEIFRRAATFVDKILKGAKPVDLPVEQPTKFELVINLKTAKALGLTIPQSVLNRADEVIR